MTGQSRVHYQTNLSTFVFLSNQGLYPWSNNNNNNNNNGSHGKLNRDDVSGVSMKIFDMC